MAGVQSGAAAIPAPLRCMRSMLPAGRGTDEPVVHEGPSHLDASWLIRGGSAPHAMLVLAVPRPTVAFG